MDLNEFVPLNHLIQVELVQEADTIERDSGLITIQEAKPKSNLVRARIVSALPEFSAKSLPYKQGSHVLISMIVPARYEPQDGSKPILLIHEDDICGYFKNSHEQGSPEKQTETA